MMFCRLLSGSRLSQMKKPCLICFPAEPPPANRRPAEWHAESTRQPSSCPLRKFSPGTYGMRNGRHPSHPLILIREWDAPRDELTPSASLSSSGLLENGGAHT